MAITVHADDVAKTALAQVGKSCGKTNPYSAELDKVNFYNGKKNGIADSCSIFVDDMVYRNTSPQTAHNARSVLYEPDVDNCGAGVVFAAQYFKAHKAWIDGKNAAKAKVGDKVIFAADKYKKKANPYGYYHTGVVVAVDTKKKKITTVEGNTNGGKVAKKTYSFTNSVITKGGFGRPKYTAKPATSNPVEEKPSDKIEEPSKPVSVPVPTPAPAKPTAPSGKTYRVIAVHGLNVRKGAGKNFDKIPPALNYGAKVTVYETKNGWGRIGTGKWVCMEFLK